MKMAGSYTVFLYFVQRIVIAVIQLIIVTKLIRYFESGANNDDSNRNTVLFNYNSDIVSETGQETIRSLTSYN